MNMIQLRIVGPGVLYLVIFFSGFWLSRSGAPYSPLILTIHKLITLATIVFFARIIYHTCQTATLSTLEFSAVVVTSGLLLGTIISGGLLSTDKPMPAVILRIHQITPFLTVLSTAVMLYLLFSRKS